MVIFHLLPVESDWTVSGTCNLITKLFSGANVLFLYCSLGRVFGLLLMAGLSRKHFVCPIWSELCENPMQAILIIRYSTEKSLVISS